MKKFKTSEDLDQLQITLPLNEARDLLTMAHRAAEEALRVLFKAKDNGIELGKLQREALESYVETYKVLRDVITMTIMTNVSLEDQAIIKEYEDANKAELQKELENIYPGRIAEAHACSDPDCDTCEPIRRSYDKPVAKSIKDEFDLSDLPEGSIIVPGSKEEN